jgi:hypothetical protein
VRSSPSFFSSSSGLAVEVELEGAWLISDWAREEPHQSTQVKAIANTLRDRMKKDLKGAERRTLTTE